MPPQAPTGSPNRVIRDPSPGFEEGWRRRFERYARAFEDDAGIAGWSAGGLAARMRRFAQLWHGVREKPAAGRWLDAGCGAGTYARFLATQGLAVTAVDYSEPTAVKARERGPRDIDFAAADVTRLPFRDAAFDGALCFGVMQALGDPERAFNELRRVVRPGGVVWIDALNASCLPALVQETLRRLRGRAPHLRYDVPRRFCAGLRASGFDTVELHWVPILPGRLRFLQGVAESRFVGRLITWVPPLGSAVSHSFLVRAHRAANSTGGNPS